MKKIILVFGIILFSITLPAQYSSEYNRVVNFMKDHNWRLTADHRTAELKEGMSTTWWNRSFSSALEYAVVAFSDDDDVLDVDVEISDLYGNSIASDEDDDDWAIATFQPSYSRTLRIRMTNYSSATPYFASRCRFLIFFR